MGPDSNPEGAMHGAICWEGGATGRLRLLDQTRLPTETVWLDCQQVEEVYEAIQRLAVRGAPAIGIAAAYGVCLAARGSDPAQALRACDRLATSRPTAVNLFWALDQMRSAIQGSGSGVLAEQLLQRARAIHQSDALQCAAIGRHGAELLADFQTGDSLITHCNTGALATGGEGTALAVVYALHSAGKRPHVYVDETRPLLQGARLTAWELMQRQIDCTLICDSMAAQAMRAGANGKGKVRAVLVGADRITANGDTANKIGTYPLAIVARHHGVPFYVAAPTSTFDLTLSTGQAIPIEQRKAEEVTEGHGRRTAPPGVPVFNPAFDVTPADLISGLITERGIARPVTQETVASLFATAAR